jgi:hypothetical protein
MEDNIKPRLQMQILIEKFLRSDESHEFKLNANDRILIFILSSYMGNKNHCWPSFRTLLKDTGIASHSTLTKSLYKLKSLHILNIKNNSKQGNEYKFEQVFINYLLQICSRVLQICSRTATDMEQNNSTNNISNNKTHSVNKKNNQNQELKQTAKFWGKGHESYDRLNGKKKD